MIESFVVKALEKKVEDVASKGDVRKLKKEIGGVNDATKLPNELRDVYKNCPKDNGKWSGERGNSKWRPRENFTPLKSNPENKDWQIILKEYGLKQGVKFKQGEINLKKVCIAEVKITGFSDERSVNFAKADGQLAAKWKCRSLDVKNFRKEYSYTWHECKDMKTMQCVPSIVHNNIPHRGGVSEVKQII